MDSILAYAREKQPEIIRLIRTMVECESPSDDPAAVRRFVELVADSVAGESRTKMLAGGRYGPHLRVEFDGRRAARPGEPKQLLVLGHSDTVYPLGTLARTPWREGEGRLWGPGVLDMKGGLAFFLFAMRALRELDLPLGRRVVLLLNSDEEVGSESSRPLTEKEARASEAVLVLEPATGLEGKLKTARKGVGDYTLVVRGRAAHAGLDFQAGANAILELARQLDRIAGFTNLKRGLTTSPGVIAGGTRSNVVPAEARAEIDVRVLRARDAVALDKKMHLLRPFDKRCSIEVSGGVNRPPMERSPGTARLFRLARRLALELGVELEESLSGGGSDGNFTAALGIPTLDGLGAVGEGAHAPHECILVDRIADRTTLLAKLVQAI